MSTYFQGLVSRFNASSRNAEINGALAASTVSKLVRLGLSPHGTVEIVTGKTINRAEDRQLLAKLLVHIATRE